MARRQKAQAHKERTIQQIAAYIRVSTEEQAEVGYGLSAQQTRCIAMCQVRDWPEPKFYADEGISGTKDETKRPALFRLLADIRSGLVDVVIILDLSRLGRNTRLVLDLVDEFSSHNVALVSCKESWDTSTPQGKFVLTLFAALGQLERDQISERTVAALNERGKIDGEKGGRLPYGYIRTPEGIAVDSIAANIVQQIFDMRQQGKSLRRIATVVSVLSKSPRGGEWYATSISEILLNQDAYLGGFRGESSVAWPIILTS